MKRRETVLLDTPTVLAASGQHSRVAPPGYARNHDVGQACADVGIVAQPLVGRHIHLASVLVAQPRALYAHPL